jgi:glucose-1-phosphate cytidylyltransferase
MTPLKVVLFCGGLGQRMRDDADSTTPKPLALIGNRPLLWHIMRYYAHFGVTDFILCLGYGAEAVKRYFLSYDETVSNDFALHRGELRLFSNDLADWNITFVDTGPAATIGERLMQVRDHIGDDEVFLANYADTLTDADLSAAVERFRHSNAVASLLAVTPVSTHHVVTIDPGGLVSEIRELREIVPWENGGYFILRTAIFDELREGEDLVPHALSRLVKQDRLLAQTHGGFWRAVDTYKDRAELEQMYRRGYRPWMVWEDRNGGARPAAVGEGDR